MKRLTNSQINKLISKKDGFGFKTFTLPSPTGEGFQVDWCFDYRGGYTIYSEEVEPARIFKSQKVAEAHAQKLADSLYGKYNGYTDDVGYY